MHHWRINVTLFSDFDDSENLSLGKNRNSYNGKERQREKERKKERELTLPFLWFAQQCVCDISSSSSSCPSHLLHLHHPLLLHQTHLRILTSPGLSSHCLSPPYHPSALLRSPHPLPPPPCWPQLQPRRRHLEKSQPSTTKTKTHKQTTKKERKENKKHPEEKSKGCEKRKNKRREGIYKTKRESWRGEEVFGTRRGWIRHVHAHGKRSFVDEQCCFMEAAMGLLLKKCGRERKCGVGLI